MTTMGSIPPRPRISTREDKPPKAPDSGYLLIFAGLRHTKGDVSSHLEITAIDRLNGLSVLLKRGIAKE
jgi:hypothetical protein